MSVANIASQSEGTARPEVTPKPTPVALEAPVRVTGTRASENSSSRDLFSEDTNTVLVFPDGGVVRLEASVSIGQLVFLTNKKSNQEVVCQVLQIHSIRPELDYVALQFTETRDNYWGVVFPEQYPLAPKQAAGERPGSTVTPQLPEDLDQLKSEAEELRQELTEVRKQTVEAASNAMTRETEERNNHEAFSHERTIQEVARAMDAIASGAGANVPGKAEPHDLGGPEPHNAPTAVTGNAGATAPQETGNPPEAIAPGLLMPGAKQTDEAPRPVVHMALPVWKKEKSPEVQFLKEEAATKTEDSKPPEKHLEATEDLLPKPELDFSRMPKDVANDNNVAALGAPKKVGAHASRTIALAAAMLLILAGGAWYGKWWQYLPLQLLNKKALVVASAVPRTPVPKTAPRPIAPGSTAPVALSSMSGDASSSKVQALGTKDSTSAVANGTGVAIPAAAQTGTASTEVHASTQQAASVHRDANSAPGNEDHLVTAPARKPSREKAALPDDEAANAQPVTILNQSTTLNQSIVADGPPQPAKRLKLVNPVYPPDAMRSYITGDVKAELVVKASGKVGDVTVLSGPQALRAAAVDALKQYQYAPATQGGRPVESKIVEVVKFWFNP